MKKGQLPEDKFLKSLTDIADIYIQLDIANKARAQLQTDNLKNILQKRLEMQKEKLEKQNNQDNIIVFPGCCQEGGNIKT